MPQSIACLNVHVVFSTKRRFAWIRPEIETRLYAFLGGIVNSNRCRLLEAGGMPDHIHLLLSLHRQISVATLIRQIKSASTRWIRTTFPRFRKFAWQQGYAAFSVSESELERVRQYIRRQKQHHRRRSFQQELRSLFRAHHLDIDERHFWD